MSNPETGGCLNTLASFCNSWFKENRISVPRTAKEWCKSSVKRGEIPPGTTHGTLRKQGITVRTLMRAMEGKEEDNKFKQVPIDQEEVNKLGFKLTNTIIKDSGHKTLEVKCNNCKRVELLDYGTLSRMRDRKDKYCRYCRKVGGKPKDLSLYNRFKDFSLVGRESSNLLYKCLKCDHINKRGISYSSTAEYIRCEKCDPINHFITKYEDAKYGTFDSKIEFLVFKKLLNYLDVEDISRQILYSKILPYIKSKHRCDFYIAKWNLILEVTTSNNNIGGYVDKMREKLSWSDRIVLIDEVKQVDDIVQAFEKSEEQLVGHSGSVRSCRRV